MGFASLGSAQTPRFRLTPIVKLGFVPNAELDGTLGINNQAQVVYGYIPPNESNMTAWLWLHVGDYSLARGFYKLRDISSSDAPDPSIAREINEAGDIAGQSDGITITAGDATVWRMASSATNFTPNIAQVSGAHAVNDDSPPKLTGRRGISGTCAFRGPYRAFEWELTGGSGTLTNQDPVDPFEDENSIGFDIGLDDTIAGNSEPCGNANACTGFFQGTAWNGSGTALPFGNIGEEENRTNYGRGVDDAGRIVGFTYHIPDQQIACRDDATFWESSSDTTPINLGLTMPSGQSGDHSRAYALNNLTNVQVVGTNSDEAVGVLWERASGTWSAIDLNTEIPCCRQNLDIREAHDINNNGWIVAWAVYDPPSGDDEVWAILLSPYTCPEDIDFDGDVDETDLALVYWSNGGCPGPAYPSGDVDNDCDVDNDDFAQIIASYGDCEGGESLGSSSTEIAMMWLAAGGEESLDSEAITIEDVADSLDEPTVGERVASLFSLIAD